MATITVKPGIVYHCSVCGAEIMTLRPAGGDFCPVCCNRPMRPLRRRAVFYRCPVCGSEVALIRVGSDAFAPRCCDTDMARLSAA